MRYILFSLLLLYPCLALSNPTESDLTKIQAQIKEEQEAHLSLKQKAKNLASEVSSVQKEMIRTANEVQDFEDSLSKLEKNLANLQEQQAAAEKQFKANKAQMALLMAALQKMAIFPAQGSLLQSGDPNDNLRAMFLLKSTRQPLEAAAKKLREDLDVLISLQSAIKAQASQIKLASARLNAKKENMERLFKQKFILQAHLESQSQEAKKKATELGQQAKDLQDLLRKLDIEEKRQQQIASAAGRSKPDMDGEQFRPKRVAGAFEKSFGSLPLPARGRIIQKYGDRTDLGATAKGITLQTRPNAQVVSIFDGKILFAGPFKGYGNLLIIEHGDGYHTLLSGLDRIDAQVGQNVLTGEPVGIMSTNASQKLYIEFRKDGQTVNPDSWFAFKL